MHHFNLAPQTYFTGNQGMRRSERAD
ncbi:MAG: hypothetical protein JWQ11_458, partial [Rhizobacter sp.]|nr:hypothetical protein [Rhizobacter sp.]